MNSWLRPLVNELKLLENGIEMFDAGLSRRITVHAHLLYVMGDLPAVAKLMKFRTRGI